MYQNWTRWRIRLTLSDDQHSRELFHEALANKPVSVVRLEPCGVDEAEITGEVMVDVYAGRRSSRAARGAGT